MILQTYKSSGCFERASKFYGDYSKVEGLFSTLRSIVLKKNTKGMLKSVDNLVRYNE